MAHGMSAIVHVRAVSYHVELENLGNSFVVEAVFPHAWLLRHRGGWILSLTTSPYNGPLAIRIERRALHDCGVMPGVTASLDDHRLRIGPVEVGLRDAVPWTPRGGSAPHERREGGRPALFSGLRRASHRSTLLNVVLHAAERYELPVPIISPCPQCDGDPSADERASVDNTANVGETAFGRRARVLVEGLFDGLLAWDQPSIRAAALDLLGLGPGLTPAGDDLLCGLLAGLVTLGPGWRSADRSSRLGRSLSTTLDEAAADRTTALARTLLHFAGRGVAVEPLLDVLWSLDQGGPIVGLDELLAIGHSSGGDMLAGALLAVASMARWENDVGAAHARPA